MVLVLDAFDLFVVVVVVEIASLSLLLSVLRIELTNFDLFSDKEQVRTRPRKWS